MTELLKLVSHPVAARLSLALLHFVWQGLALAIVAAGLLLALRTASAASRYAALVAVLGAMAVCPAITFTLVGRAPARSAVLGAAASPALTSVAGASPIAGPVTAAVPVAKAQVRGPTPASTVAGGDERPRAWDWARARLAWVSLLWATGVVVLSLRFLVRGWALWWISSRLMPADARWQDLVASLCHRLTMSRPARLLVSAGARVPMVIGWLRPAVVIPASALTGLTPEQLTALVAHELAHIRRYDQWVGLAQALVELLLFYHPAVWWVSRAIRVEREHCCDDMAVALSGDVAGYMRALAWADGQRGRHLEPTVAASGSPLAGRIRRLAGYPAPAEPRSSWLAGALALLLVAAVLAVGTLSGKSVRAAPAAQLPADITPILYELDISPDLDAGTFESTVDITVRLSKPRREIVLDAEDLQVLQAEVRALKGALKLQPVLNLDNAAGLLTLALPQELPAGDYVLHLESSGKMPEEPKQHFTHGLFRLSATGPGGDSDATAVMMRGGARYVFPCFDRLTPKPRFRLTARVERGLIAVSSAPISQTYTDAETGKTVIQFEETPPLLIHELALCVGDMEATEPRLADGIPVRVWVPRGKGRSAAHTRDVAARFLSHYRSYFGAPYPWRKLDLVAVLNARWSAFNEAGVILLDAGRTLVDPDTPAGEQAWPTRLVATGIAHQWFGGLVSIAGWDDFWLIQAFPTWAGIRGTQGAYTSERAWALWADCLQSAWPLSVDTPNWVAGSYMRLASEKGAAVLHMLASYLGDEAFRKGLQRYLQDHAFGNATSDDLWKAMEEASGVPGAALGRPWVKQSGYPVVELVPNADGQLVVTQKPFCVSGPAPDPSALWQVPLRLRAVVPGGQEKQPAPEVRLLTARQQTIAPPAGGLEQSLLANAGAIGYYLVHYTREQLLALLPHIQADLEPAERDDLFAGQWRLTQAGVASIYDLLLLLPAYRGSWGSLWEVVDFLDRIVSDEARGSYQRFVCDLLRPGSGQVGWSRANGEKGQVAVLPVDELAALGTLGQDQEVIAGARRLFGRYLTDAKGVSPELIDGMLQVVAYNASAEDMERIMALYRAVPPDAMSERLRYMVALSYLQQAELIERALEWSVSAEVDPVFDRWYLLCFMLDRRAAHPIAWRFLKEHWNELFGEEPNAVTISWLYGATTEELLEDLKVFLAAHPATAAEPAAGETLEQISLNVAVGKRLAGALNRWLKEHYPAR